MCKGLRNGISATKVAITAIRAVYFMAFRAASPVIRACPVTIRAIIASRTTISHTTAANIGPPRAVIAARYTTVRTVSTRTVYPIIAASSIRASHVRAASHTTATRAPARASLTFNTHITAAASDRYKSRSSISTVCSTWYYGSTPHSPLAWRDHSGGSIYACMHQLA